jgi:hypothetical protein
MNTQTGMRLKLSIIRLKTFGWILTFGLLILENLPAATLVFDTAFDNAGALSSQLVYESQSGVANSLSLTDLDGTLDPALNGSIRALVEQNLFPGGTDIFSAYLVKSSAQPTFTPSAQGAIESLTFSIDLANITSQKNALDALYFPALIQDGNIYLWDTLTTTGSTSFTTYSRTFTDLNDFDLLRSSGASGVIDLGTTGDVDATLTGSAIELALIIAGSSNTNNQRDGAFDNVTYTIDYAAIPEVSSMVLLTLALGTARIFLRVRA